jgi:hypothetical protein
VTLFSWEVFPLCHCFAVAIAAVHESGAALQLPLMECIIQELQLFVAVEMFREQVNIDSLRRGIDMEPTSLPVRPEHCQVWRQLQSDHCVRA